jgi:excinuclease ABC subunit C
MDLNLKPQNLEKTRTLPTGPGVYIFFNASQEVIYVGKAVNLRRRVLGYFQKTLEDGKTKKLVSDTSSFSYINVFSEVEALILEAELIKKYLPKYNINLKDDKSYIYVVIRQENGSEKVLLARRGDIKPHDKVFGPYPDARTTRSLLRLLRRVFPYRDCSEAKFSKYKKLATPCLYGHIGLCPAPCSYPITSLSYSTNIRRLERFLRGQTNFLVSDVHKSMRAASKLKNYEEAASQRDLLTNLNYMQQTFRLPKEFMENPYLVEDIALQALTKLHEILPDLKAIPARIECYDIANISGKSAACSMVVALHGKLTKSQYRKFKIKLLDTPDDYFMMREALTRRFLHETRAKLVPWGLPDLVVVDGGKGQVSVAIDVLERAGLDIPVIGLAKKRELIVIRKNGDYSEISLESDNEGLKLLQRLRDEAHRFARVYHHKLRSDTI